MKRLFVFLGAISLTLMLVLGGPLHSTATPSAPNSEVDSLYSKKIEDHLVILGNVIEPPSTYFYNVGGWTGILRLNKFQRVGDQVRAYYSGTVNCTAPCIASTDEES